MRHNSMQPKTRASHTETPAALDRIAQGYRAAQALFTAVRLGLFDTLGRRAMSAPELADAMVADSRGTRIVCDALVALGLLLKRDNRYLNSPITRAWLLKTSPTSQSALYLHNAALYDRWSHLFDVVKTGHPASADVADPRWRSDARSFARAMAATATTQAAQTAAQIDLRGARRMLDIGGGPGVYAIAFAQRWPKLHITILDGAKTVAVARENIVRARLARRIDTRAGDALECELGGPYDLVLLSNVVHQYPPRTNARLVARATGALAVGGRLAVKDFVLNARRDGPAAASLFAINMLVNTPEGDCYTAAEIRGWMREAGLRWEKQVSLRAPSRLLIGRKPG